MFEGDSMNDEKFYWSSIYWSYTSVRASMQPLTFVY